MNYLDHSPINCYFAKNPRNFVVEEIPLYNFSGSGEHLVLKIRKKNLTTYELLQIISEKLHIKRNDIGYAGLKDKDGLTIQHISIDKKLIKNVESIECENIKILDSIYHNNKLKIGHLKGNKFFIRLKKLDFINAKKLQNICDMVAKQGMPNYFGYQRFGRNNDNFSEGRAILEKKLRMKNKKIAQFLISAYQSHLFNEWLKKRVEFSKVIKYFNDSDIMAKYPLLNAQTIKKLKQQPHFFKLLEGDVMQHYPNGALFFNDTKCNNDKNLDSCIRFYNHQIAPTGLLYGTKVKIATNIALEFEQDFIDTLLDNQIGHRRFAWVFVENLKFTYKKDIANGELNFALPKGSYATILLEILLNKELDS